MDNVYNVLHWIYAALANVYCITRLGEFRQTRSLQSTQSWEHLTMKIIFVQYHLSWLWWWQYSSYDPLSWCFEGFVLNVVKYLWCNWTFWADVDCARMIIKQAVRFVQDQLNFSSKALIRLLLVHPLYIFHTDLPLNALFCDKNALGLCAKIQSSVPVTDLYGRPPYCLSLTVAIVKLPT